MAATETVKDQQVVLAGGAVGVVMLLGCWVLAPRLQGAEAAAADQASACIERARRILHQYDVHLERKGVVRDELRSAGTDVDVEHPTELVDNLADEFQSTHATYWSLFPPNDWNDDFASPAKASYGNLTGLVSGGLRGQNALLQQNAGMLDKALAAVDEACSLSGETETGSALSEAHRLKAFILLRQGFVELEKSRLRRQSAQGPRMKLTQLWRQALEKNLSMGLPEQSGISGKLDEVRSVLTDSERRLDASQRELNRIDRLVADLEGQWESARRSMEKARSEMEETVSTGVDFSDPHGAEAFAARLQELDRDFRLAMRQVHALEHGHFSNARLARPDEFLLAPYVRSDSPGALEVIPGLAHHRRRQTILRATVERQRREVEDLKTDLGRLDNLRQSFVDEITRANREVAGFRDEAVNVFDELTRLESEASASEDRALALFAEAERAALSALEAIKQVISQSRERAMTLSPEVRDRSVFQMRSQDQWLAGHAGALVADTRLARAYTLVASFEADTRSGEVVAATAKELDLNEADPSAWSERALQAKEEAIKAVTQASESLQLAYREAGNHWTFVAQQAGANDLMVRLGESSYRRDELEGYRNAVKGREQEPFMGPYRDRIDRLERR